MEKVLRTTGLLRVARCKAWKEKSRARCKAFPCNFPRLRREVASDPRAWEWLCGPRCVPWVGEERQGPATEVSSIHAVVTSLIATALGSGYYCPHLINGSSDSEMFIDVPGALRLHPGPYSSLISWSSRTSGLTFSATLLVPSKAAPCPRLYTPSGCKPLNPGCDLSVPTHTPEMLLCQHHMPQIQPSLGLPFLWKQ